MQFNIIHMATSLFTVACVSATAAWYIKGNQVEIVKERMAVYELAQDLNIPKLTENLSLVSKSLGDQLSIINKNRELEEGIEILKTEGLKLKSDSEAKSVELAKLKLKIKTLFSFEEQFELSNGESKKLLEAQHSLGVKIIYESSALITIDNEKISMEVGQFINVNWNEKKCRIFFDSISSYNRIQFSVLCEKA